MPNVIKTTIHNNKSETLALTDETLNKIASSNGGDTANILKWLNQGNKVWTNFSVYHLENAPQPAPFKSGDHVLVPDAAFVKNNEGQIIDEVPNDTGTYSEYRIQFINGAVRLVSPERMCHALTIPEKEDGLAG